MLFRSKYDCHKYYKVNIIYIISTLASGCDILLTNEERKINLSELISNSSIYLGNPQLETKRLILRRYTPEDDEQLHTFYSDKVSNRYLTWDVHQTMDETTEFLESALEMYESDEAGEWGVELKETRELIGACGFAWCDLQHSCAQIGFMLSSRYWGRGLMTEAVRAVIGFGLERMGLNRIEGFHVIGNEAAGRVMEKAGMQPEGVLREKILLDGRFCDLKMYSILKNEHS